VDCAVTETRNVRKFAGTERLKEPDLDSTKGKFDGMLKGAAANEPVEELESVEIALPAKADRERGTSDRLDRETARLLGLDAKATYADALLYCRAALIRALVPG
jgi:hypothetical protein